MYKSGNHFSKDYANFSWVVSLLLAKYPTLTEHIFSLGINCLLNQENSFYPQRKNLFCQNEGSPFFFSSQSASNNFRIQSKVILITTSECNSGKNFKSYFSFLKTLRNYFFSHKEFREKSLIKKNGKAHSELWFF